MAAKSTVKLTLKYPIEDIEPNVTELIVRRPKVKDQKAADNAGQGAAESEVILFAALCNTSVQVIDEMDMKDYGDLQAIYEKMVGGKT